MNRSDEFEDRFVPTSRSAGRTHRWIGPVLGAVLGILLGTAIVTLAAAYLPEGSAWFGDAGISLQLAGAVLGAIIGAFVTSVRR